MLSSHYLSFLPPFLSVLLLRIRIRKKRPRERPEKEGMSWRTNRQLGVSKKSVCYMRMYWMHER